MKVEILNKIITEFQKYYKDKIIKTGHNASGQLANTQSFEVEYNNDNWLITLKMEEYWKYLEYGRKSGKMPPIDDILSWINVKKILPRGNKKPITKKQLAYVIARSIGKKGLPATHLLEKSMTEFNFKNKVLRVIFQKHKEELDKHFTLFYEGKL